MVGLPLTLVFALVLPKPPAPSADDVSCADERLEGVLEGGPDRWRIGCLPLAENRVLIAAIPEDESEVASEGPRPADQSQPAAVSRSDAAKTATAPTPPPPPSPSTSVELVLFQGTKLLWQLAIKLDAAASPELADVLDHAEEWAVSIKHDDIGGANSTTRVARVGVHGRWGEDYTHDQEIAILVRLPNGPEMPKLVWFGLGSTQESRFDVCRLESRAQFRMVGAEGALLLERRLRSRRLLTRQRVDAQLAASLVRRCTVRPRPTARFPVLP
jgi:hypothetical protein